MKTILRTILKGVLTICMAALLLFPVRAAATEVGEPGDNIASGTVEGITWIIDAEGKLTITGTGDLPEGYHGYYLSNYGHHFITNMPWGSYAEQITSAKIDVSGMTDASCLFCGCYNLASVGVSSFDTSQVTDMSYMFYECSSLTSVDLGGLDTSQVTNMSSMFCSCSSLTSMDLRGIDTSHVTDMSHMFYGCSSLTSMDLSGIDASHVTDMSDMFDGCSSLTSMDLSNIDTSQVTYMDGMFARCSSLTSVDLGGLDTSQVTSMYKMFSGCSGLTSVNLSGLDTGQVTNMYGMFYECSGLTSVNLSGIDTSHVTDMSNMFYECSSLTSMDLRGIDASHVTDMSNMFYGCSSLTSMDLRGIDTSHVTDMSNMFYQCSNLTSVNMNGLDASRVTYMMSMFEGCSGLSNVNMSDMETSQVTSMSRMFYECNSLTNVSLDGLDTSKVTDMGEMFDGCSSLISVNLRGIDTSQVTDMGEMFYGCSNLTSLDVSGFDTSQVKYMPGMFCGCRSLTSLDVSGFDTSKVINMRLMFSNCSSLASLDVSGFSSNQVNMWGMFSNCSSLTSLDLSGFDMSYVTNVDEVYDGVRYGMLTGCSSLTSLNTPLNLQVSALLPEVEGLSWHMPDGTVVTELPQNLDYSVLLTRDVSAPEITTTTADLNMEDVIRVQYVPYSYTVETSNTDVENKVTFSIEEGTLPEGLMIYPATGEIYGVPMEVGEFPLTIKATFSNEQYLPSYAKITLTVLENTAENIAKATESGYEITQPVTDFRLEGMDGERTQTLVSQGEFAQFKDVYLDGRKLIRDEEYTAVEGSTRITIKNQTLGNAGVGTHTLGIEFRTEEGTLKRAAQNYTVSQTSTGSGSTGQPGSSETGSQSGNQPGNQSGVTASNGSSSGSNSNNTAGTQAVATEAQMTEIIYTVQPGDNLWKIAAKYRRQGVTWQRIYADNRIVIRNPGLIFAGQQLRICFIATQGTEASAAGTLGTYSEKYSVRQGDTLWGIAVKTYGDGRLWTRIYEANRDVLENPDRLRIGQILTLGQ